MDDGDGTEYLHVKDLHVGKVYHILGRHILLYDADDFTLHYKLGHSLSTALTTLPLLEGLPINPDIDAAMADVKQTISAAGVTPEQVVRLCEEKTPGEMQLAKLRSCLLEWGMEPNENVCSLPLLLVFFMCSFIDIPWNHRHVRSRNQECCKILRFPPNHEILIYIQRLLLLSHFIFTFI